MPATGTDYDNYYACLGLDPGRPLEEILKAARKLMREHHPDRFPNDPRRRGEVQEVFKEVSNAQDELERWWRAHGCTPPSEQRERREKEQLRRPRQAEQERQRRAEEEGVRREQEARRQEADRKANLPIDIPRVLKSPMHFLAEYLEVEDRIWMLYIGGFLALFIASNVFFKLLNEDAWQEGTPAILLAAVLHYLLCRGFSSYSKLCRLDRSRDWWIAPKSADAILSITAEVLQRHSRGEANWELEPPTADAADATTKLTARLRFTGRCLGLIEIRYVIALVLKAKPAVHETKSRVAYWFEREASMSWWPPAWKVIEKLQDDLKRSLGIS